MTSMLLNASLLQIINYKSIVSLSIVNFKILKFLNKCCNKLKNINVLYFIMLQFIREAPYFQIL